MFLSPRVTKDQNQKLINPFVSETTESACICICITVVANWPPSRKLSKLDEPDTQVTAGETRTNSSVIYSYGPPHMAKPKQDDQLEHTYSSYVRIRDVALKTSQKRWMIGRSGERGLGISVLAAQHDDDDDDDYCCYWYLYEYTTIAIKGYSTRSRSLEMETKHYLYVSSWHEQDATKGQFSSGIYQI